MREFIYKDNGKYWRTLADLTGKPFYTEEISEAEYMSYKKGARHNEYIPLQD